MVTMAASLQKARPGTPNPGGSIRSLNFEQKVNFGLPTSLRREPVYSHQGNFGWVLWQAAAGTTSRQDHGRFSESPSLPDDRHIDIPPILDALAENITLDKLKTMRKTLKESSAGPDGVPVDLIKGRKHLTPTLHLLQPRLTSLNNASNSNQRRN